MDKGNGVERRSTAPGGWGSPEGVSADRPAAGPEPVGLAKGAEAARPAEASAAPDDPAEDPYGTPPYGQPGPWAPAPPVQRPDPTPPAGTRLPADGGSLGGQAVLAGPPPAAPHRYDPWAVPPAAGLPPAAPAVAAPAGPPPARPRAAALLAGAALVALLAGVIGGVVGVQLERNGAFSDVRLPQSPVDSSATPSGSISGIASALLPGVVTLHAPGGSSGTGFVLDERGHILTNAHVVGGGAGSGTVEVTFSSGDTVRGSVVGRHRGYDLAVVRVDGVAGLTPLGLGNSDGVRVGDPVVAIGSPFGLAGTVTSGIISATERPITAGGEQADGSDISYVNALQTDAPINPGNSGGPLADADGRVIGVNSAIRSVDNGGLEAGSVGLGFAIPINQAKDVAEQLINTGRATHPVIGVTLDTRHTGTGARVGSSTDDPAVVPGGPADEAGVRDGDVITAVDGDRVRDADELIIRIRSHRPGDELVLTVERDGRELELTAVLGESDGD
ncbi:trypsin-like peptidase domain-containing protein [Streptomyces sp. DSM 44915]|uniref:Trypsin-like peptidase domain-containing protein n=1 Tax=Streptomyces chisholmiae TaxID=3075540 RepID=A0ABU2JL40_9ACTN|nr:trypsin-like peptidase domain-containing protein [Streptomyces sp. DSM 44915]MDT0265461.1 trypsin-like peptidase domain-containing protein [Streptomyces sp. DSM 44915]